MSVRFDKTIKTLARTLQDTNKRGTKPYETEATVVRVEGDTLWVHIDGGADETPVKKTIAASIGDTVHIKIANKSAYIVGNYTAPPSDSEETLKIVEEQISSGAIRGRDGEPGKDGAPGQDGASTKKVEIVYCLALSDAADEDGEPEDMISEDWQADIPTLADVPIEEGEETIDDPEEIADIPTNGYVDLGYYVSELKSFKVNGTEYTDYTLETLSEEDDEGEMYTTSIARINPETWPSSVTNITYYYVEAIDPLSIFYIWMRTLTYTTDMEEGDDPEEGVPSIYGTLTAEGGTDFKVRTIIREEKWFCLATAVALGPGQKFEDIQKTEWSTTIPDIKEAKDEFSIDLYYWTYIKYYYSDGTTAVSPPYYDFSAQIAYEVSQAETSQDNHFWSNANGAFVGHYENDPDRDHVVKVVGEGVLLYKDGERMASFTDSGVAFRGKVGGTWTELARYTNLGISFAQNVDYTIGDPSGQYIKWDSANKRIVICAQSLVYGSNNVDLATELDSVKTKANTADTNASQAKSTASTANTNATSAYNKAVAAQNAADKANNLIYMSGSGLYVVNSSDTSQKILIDSYGMNVYYSGTSVAQFGASTRIGYNNSWHISLDNTKLSFYNSSGSSIGYIGTWQDTEEYLSGIQISSALPALFLTSNKVKIFCGSDDNAFVVRCNNKKMIEYNYSSSAPYNRLRFPEAYHTGSASGKQAYINEYGWLNASSSKREIKTDITSEFNSENNPRNLYNVPVRQFKYKEGYIDPDDYNYGKDVVGIIAEEIDEAYPVGAYHEMDGTPGDWDIRTVVPAMLKLIQEQHEEIEAIKAQLN